MLLVVKISQRKLLVIKLAVFKLVRKKWLIDCVKNVRIRSYFGPHFPAFGLNTERYGEFSTLGLNTEYLSIFSPNAGKCGPE